VLKMPKPGTEHLEAMLPSLCIAIAREQGLDERFVPPLSSAEVDDVRWHWGGGSIRRLRQAIEVVLGARGLFETKH
jgi:ATP-dependent Lon protease